MLSRDKVQRVMEEDPELPPLHRHTKSIPTYGLIPLVKKKLRADNSFCTTKERRTRQRHSNRHPPLMLPATVWRDRATEPGTDSTAAGHRKKSLSLKGPPEFKGTGP